MFRFGRTKKVMVPYVDNCQACHLFSLERRVCMGPHGDKKEEELTLCSEYKLDLETFASLIPKNFKITRWARVKNGYMFWGEPKPEVTEEDGERESQIE